MRLHELTEGLDSNQRRVGQVSAEEKASLVSPVLGKKDKQHPFKGRLVGEQGVAEGPVTKKPQPYNDPDWTKKLTKDQLDALAGPRYNKDKKKQSEGKVVKEFAPAGNSNPPRGPKTPGSDPWGGNDGGEDPYGQPKPEYYPRSSSYFEKFESDHFDKEDFDDAAGVFKGYWDYDGELRQIAYFKFDNPAKTGGDDPGMGWYYEPNEDSNTGPSAEPTVDNSAQRKQQELSMINAFLKSGQTPKPGSQIHGLMKKHGMVEGVAEGETEYGPEWDEKIQRLKKLAGMGPLKTVWDPEKRVYKNVPVNQKSDNDQKKSSVKEAQMAPGIKDVLKTKGYKYVGHGQDQDVFIGSDGWVLKVFGWDRDQKKNGFTRAQQSFIDFANFCKKNAGNEFLPNFSGWTSFKFRDQTYLQIRCERLFPLDKKWPTLGKELDNFATLVQKSGAESAIKKYVKVIHDTEGLAIPMFLGKEGLQQFANTLEKVIKLGQSKGYSIDLHSGNFMFGSDGQIVINDPFFTGSYRGGWGGWGL